MTIIERLVKDALNDDYFRDLTSRLEKMTAFEVFFERIEYDQNFTEQELRDLLRFADILSNSEEGENRNTAYRIIALLNNTFHANPAYKVVAQSVLINLGNFPAIDFIFADKSKRDELPFDKEVERVVKAMVQTVPGSDNVIFTDSQFQLFKQITESKYFSFSGPTSVGKSFIIKSAIRNAIAESPRRNMVIMVPTRALINQFAFDLKDELGDLLRRYRYDVLTNSNFDELPEHEPKNYIFVLTPERLISFLSQKEKPRISYLFVDEAHKIAAQKDVRSITAFVAISSALRHFRDLNLYFASPNVSNPEAFLKLFQTDELRSARIIEAPVTQNLYFIDFPNKTVNRYEKEFHFEFTPAIVEDAENIFELIAKLGKSEKNIVYCHTRNHTIEYALRLAEYLPPSDIAQDYEVRQVISEVKTHIHKDYYLADLLAKGVAFHFGNLPQVIRNKVENLFKHSRLNYVFCTSTLLEGVNLPAKNIFILNNKNGRQRFEPIDFRNLAGRAGRFRHELFGNIFCVKENDDVWKKHSEFFDSTDEIAIQPTIESQIQKKGTKLKEILEEDSTIRLSSGYNKDILSYVANLITIDVLEEQRTEYRSHLIERIIKEEKEDILGVALDKQGSIEVPSEVLQSNHTIKVKIQNEVYLYLKERSYYPHSIRLPRQVSYDACRGWLNRFYELFQWGTEEQSMFGGTDRDGQLRQLNYYAFLMVKWINGESLNQIIRNSIDYYKTNGSKVRVDFRKYEPFDGSAKHINVIIGELIDNIEQILRFRFEKYFNCYYSLVASVLGEENAGVNWATFLEYGTTDPVIISLQNLGLSRHSANYLVSSHREALQIRENKLAGIYSRVLKRNLDPDALEFEEITTALNLD